MEIRDNILHIGGISARDLVDEFKSPLYVYEEDTIRARAGELKNAITFANKEIKFACKANTNLEIMKVLKDEGMGIDAVSPGEIFAALKAGFAPDRILFTTNNVLWEEIEYAVSKNVLANLDSLSQLRMFGERFPCRDVCVRINPNVGAGHHDHVITGGPESKFGINYTEVDDIKDIAEKYRLRMTGIHQHIGSGILEPEMFIKAMDVLLETAKYFDDLSFIDFGGGIGVPYRENEKRIDIAVLGKMISERFASFADRQGGGGHSVSREKDGLKLVIEPGRYLVAESGFLLATVASIKAEKKHRFVGIDTGFNHLVRPAMYGSYHQILHTEKAENPGVKQVIAGNLCESGDTFTRDENGIVDRDLPLFNEGDIVCLCNAGAYGYSMASFYNSRPRPAEVLVKEGSAKLIRRRETYEEIFTGSR
ncbi:MAG TPA: diaminopimelate decarboxylase [Spirochaetes bacterium]|nr:diaminopimelate decarboxylase [Spirochaetota bacterium]